MKNFVVSMVVTTSLLMACSGDDPNPSPSKLDPPAADAKSQPELPAVSVGWVPSEACSFLDPALVTRGYKHDFEDEYHCSSSYQELGATARGLPNNLAYYVTGTSSIADTVKLVLNYNQPTDARAATDQLVAESKTLAIKATGNEIPENTLVAIAAGRSAVETSGQFKHEVKRDDWPTGRGYEIHYVVTKVERR
ncbi:hypothetical protein [Lysobacter sp. ESA13C]|uniref:hypothetical protein n=1 Tax=Lysobacter sp. ESA13C TaxID=2862676 RepID=UPI001CBF187B|nr:hypothetical protein [Lysobacter sp. ESA13C]